MAIPRLLHQLRNSQAVTAPEQEPALPPDQPPGLFSCALAAALADLCRLATTGGGPVVRERGENLFVAFPSGETWDCLGIDPETISPPAPGPAGGRIFGPLAQSFELPPLAVGARIWLTGHGAGGAHALIAAPALQHRGHRLAAIYTFGAPRTGDRAFGESIAAPHFRIVNNQDPVPDLPPPGPWRHHGTHLLIHDNGFLDLHPTPISRAGLFLRQTAWLGELLVDGLQGGYPRALYSLFARVLRDHALDEYARRLRRAATT